MHSRYVKQQVERFVIDYRRVLRLNQRRTAATIGKAGSPRSHASAWKHRALTLRVSSAMTQSDQPNRSYAERGNEMMVRFPSPVHYAHRFDPDARTARDA
jgi:hypothetical protein